MAAAPVIAIVDDDASVRASLGGLLRSFDFAVHLCASGQELLDAAWLPDLSCVITDVRMPGLSGFDVCTAIRARKLTMPVIFMTAFCEPSDAQEATHLLHKPFTATELMCCIDRAVQRWHARDADD